jgi:hypothetical protein
LCQRHVARHRRTEGSNPSPSTGESANFWFLRNLPCDHTPIWAVSAARAAVNAGSASAASMHPLFCVKEAGSQLAAVQRREMGGASCHRGAPFLFCADQIAAGQALPRSLLRRHSPRNRRYGCRIASTRAPYSNQALPSRRHTALPSLLGGVSRAPTIELYVD